MAVKNPDVTVSNIYFPKDRQIMVHQSRVKCCPLNFPVGFYWYGSNQKSQGKVPKWVENLLGEGEVDDVIHIGDDNQDISGDDYEKAGQLQGATNDQLIGSVAETDVPLAEVEGESLVQLPVKTARSRSNVGGYSLRKEPHPSQKFHSS